ncbi:MAG: hypothetical protein V3Q69_12790 [Burkholderia sp.]
MGGFKVGRYVATIDPKYVNFTQNAWRCCINRAKSIDVYAQRSLGQPPYQLRFQSNCLIFPRKCARTYTRKVSRRHTTVSGSGRPIIQA